MHCRYSKNISRRGKTNLKDKKASKSYFYTLLLNFRADESLGRLLLSHTVCTGNNEHYQLDMQQADTVTTGGWKETKPPWSHCVRWLLQATSPLKSRKPRCHGTSPQLNLSQAHLALKRPPTGPAPCGMAAREKAAGLHRALCKPHQYHQRLRKLRTHPLAGTHLTPFLPPPASEELPQVGTPLGHNSLEPFLMPRRASKMKKCLFHSTCHTDRLAQPLESTSCSKKLKHRETSGLGKQFQVSRDANSFWKYKGHLEKN